MAKAKLLVLTVAWALTACSEKAAPAPRTAAGAGLPPPAFKDHPAQVYTGPLVKPDIVGASDDLKMYRTGLREAAAAGVRFGGKYGVMTNGCGAECIFGFVIDETNGQAIPLPVGTEGHRRLQLAYRPDSLWMRAIWVTDSYGEPSDCVVQDFVMEEGTFRSVKKGVLDGMCPEMDEKTGESTGRSLY